MLDLLEAIANLLLLPSAAIGLLIGALVGACVSWFMFGEMNYQVIAGTAVMVSFLNLMLFKYLDRDKNKSSN